MQLSKNSTDTIVALATPKGRGGVGIVRISGPNALLIGELICKKTLRPRYATYTAFWDELNNQIDDGIALFFSGPNSFTGEDVIELQGHGGSIVTDYLIKRAISLGAIHAKPGEFTLRAFLNNKIDLTQAEAIADLINANSYEAARASIRSLQGEFSKKITTIVNKLIELRKFTESSIDFSEEEIDFINNEQIKNNLLKIINQVEDLEASAKQGSLLREGLTIVITGKPNVGKSSLLNCLSGKDIAIVTSIPGTTRDILREQIIIGGMPINFVDTAGLRESKDIIEQEGIKRAKEEIKNADLVIHIVDARETLEEKEFGVATILVRNKIDLTNESSGINKIDNKIIIALSVKNNQGVDLLIEQIKLSAGLQNNSEGIFTARRRHLLAISNAKEFLFAGLKQVNHSLELLSEDLRQAQIKLNELTGEFTSDDLLGEIFSSFCIGK